MEIDKIYNQDCLVGLAGIPDKGVDLVLTDIPYGGVNREDNGLRNLDKGAADVCSFDVGELTRALCKKTRGSIYMFCGREQISTIYENMAGGGAIYKADYLGENQPISNERREYLALRHRVLRIWEKGRSDFQWILQKFGTQIPVLQERDTPDTKARRAIWRANSDKQQRGRPGA